MVTIGQGANWQVRRLGDNKHVFRVPLYPSEIRINEFIKNHKQVKALGLPTLEKVKRYENNGDKGLICEDLNISGDRIYVSPNSLYSDADQEFDEIREVTEGKSMGNKQLSEAEQFRYEHKLDEITNIEEFIKAVKVDLDFVTGKNVGIYFDAYFFGTLKYSSRSTIDYILGDLDDIRKFTRVDRNELLAENRLQFQNIFSKFLEHFVNPGKRGEYLDILNREIGA